MERLSDKCPCNMLNCPKGGQCDFGCEKYAQWVADMRKALTAYEDAEEQGKLVRLPCKVGDTVYWNTGVSIREYEVKGYVVEHCKGKKTTRIILDDLAPCFPHPALFFTREAAKAALAEMTDTAK